MLHSRCLQTMWTQVTQLSIRDNTVIKLLKRSKQVTQLFTRDNLVFKMLKRSHSLIRNNSVFRLLKRSDLVTQLFTRNNPALQSLQRKSPAPFCPLSKKTFPVASLRLSRKDINSRLSTEVLCPVTPPLNNVLIKLNALLYTST